MRIMAAAAKKTTKMDLIEGVYANSSCRMSTVKEIVDLFISGLRESLESGSTIELRGFGTFEIRKRRGRKSARNPKTGEKVSVKEHSVVVFRAGRDLKKAVWQFKGHEGSQKPENGGE